MSILKFHNEVEEEPLDGKETSSLALLIYFPEPEIRASLKHSTNTFRNTSLNLYPSAAFRSNSMNGSTITLNTVDKIKDVKEEITSAEYKGYLREKTHMFQVL